MIKHLLSIVFLVGLCGDAFAERNSCVFEARRAADFAYDQAMAECQGNTGGSLRCQIDYDCSSDESCMSGHCVRRPTCDVQIRCDECFLGLRNCRVIDCRGNIKSEYREQCSARNTFACGACDVNGRGSRYALYSYPIFQENQAIDRSDYFGDLPACANARATDPRCNGN